MNDQKTIKNLIRQLEQKLGLTFIENEEGNVCMANRNSELRDEFKQSFTLADVQCYITAALTHHNQAIPLPENEMAFWQLVQKGKEESAKK